MTIREEVLDWLKEIHYLNEMIEYIKIPSISRDKENVTKLANQAKKILEELGFKVTILETDGNNALIAELISNEKNPTVLFYGHMDVQPVDPISLWKTDPFEPIQIEDKLFGRGTADNKGQHYAHLLAFKFINQHYPDILKKVNIKVILDGDEELGSYSLPSVIKNNKDKLDADFVYVSDGPSLVYDAPTIVGSVRGILSFEIEIKNNNEDLHSGNFGGLARSSSIDLINLLSTMVDEQGHCKIDGFYDTWIKPTEDEIKYINQLDEIYNKIIDNKKLDIAPVHKDSNKFQNQLYPTFNINGLFSGGVGDKRRTIIPSSSIASIDCRLVPNMNSEKVKEVISNHIKNWAKSKGIEKNVRIDFEHSMEPIGSAINMPYINKISKAAENGFGVKPIIVPRLGGSLPIYLFPEFLNKPVVLVPYALPDENNHAPNENLDLPYFESGVATSVALLIELAK